MYYERIKLLVKLNVIGARLRNFILSTTLEPDRYAFHDSLMEVSRRLGCRVERQDGISRTITFEISKLTVAPVVLQKEGATYTCTHRHRSGLDIAWVRRRALSRYTPDTAYHDFYPSIKTKGSISSFCTVPRLRCRILRLFSLYLCTWTTRPVVVVHILVSVYFRVLSCSCAYTCARVGVFLSLQC